MTIVLMVICICIAAYLTWSWWGQREEITNLKESLREAETPRVLRRSTEETWLYGRPQAAFRFVATPALILVLAGIALFAIVAAQVEPPGSAQLPADTRVTDSLLSATSELESEIQDLINQMFRQGIANAIMVDELNCVIGRVDAGVVEEAAREVCRDVVRERRDSLASSR